MGVSLIEQFSVRFMVEMGQPVFLAGSRGEAALGDRSSHPVRNSELGRLRGHVR